jgi:hypothetical protein
VKDSILTSFILLGYPNEKGGRNGMEIKISESFWTTAIITSQELYKYKDENGNEVSAECLGNLWGMRRGISMDVQFGTTTQLIEHRDENSVVGPNPFDHLLHSAWTVLDVSECNYIGSFHSHPWSEEEVKDFFEDGYTDDVFWEASDTDKDSIPRDHIEIIVSLRPLCADPLGSLAGDSEVKVNESLYEWKERNGLVSGKIDIFHVTLSGWYKNDCDDVYRVPIKASFLEDVNRRIAAIDARGKSE